MKSFNQLCFTAASSVSLLVAVTCNASTVYEATYTGSGSQPFFGSSFAYGDEIVLAGTARVATEFTFAYYSTYDLPAGGTLSFYWNDGPLVDGYASPGTSFFSTTFDIVSSPTGIDVSVPFVIDPSDPLPDRLTFVVQFGGYTESSPAGLLLADAAPSVGASGNDFWIDDAWELNTIPGYIANFEAKLTAVPEASPGSVAAITMTAFGVFAGYRRMQRK